MSAIIRFGVYLTIEEMEAAAKWLADEHEFCDDVCALKRVAIQLVATAREARKSVAT